jgi:hypothetical protein
MNAARLSRGTLLVAGRGERGSLPRSEVVRFLGPVRKCHVCSRRGRVHPADDYDPFSNACLEALAAGLPVITTAHNGFGEIIEHGVEGEVLGDPREIDALARALEKWSDPERRAAVAHGCSKKARDTASKKTCARHWRSWRKRGESAGIRMITLAIDTSTPAGSVALFRLWRPWSSTNRSLPIEVTARRCSPVWNVRAGAAATFIKWPSGLARDRMPASESPSLRRSLRSGAWRETGRASRPSRPWKRTRTSIWQLAMRAETRSTSPTVVERQCVDWPALAR